MASANPHLVSISKHHSEEVVSRDLSPTLLVAQWPTKVISRMEGAREVWSFYSL